MKDNHNAMPEFAGQSVLYTNLNDIGGPEAPLVARLQDAVQAYGGVAGSQQPPAFVASFADSDHPERAIRAALAMRDELAALNEEGHTAHNHTLRVAVHTIDGQLADPPPPTNDDDDRILQRVPPNSVVVSHNTYRYVRGVFDVEPVHGLDPKGDMRDSHYIVVRSRPRQFHLSTRAVAGRETPTVGRSRERAHLTTTLHEMLNTEQLRAVSLVGPAGIGKSRVLYDFRNYLELFDTTVWLFQARCRPAARFLPYGLVRDLFAFRFEIYSGDTVATARRTLVEGVQRFIPGKGGEATAHYIGALIGLDFMYSDHLRALHESGQPVHERGIEAVAAFFAAVAADDPAVILIEGLHHADDASLDALRYLFQGCRGSRLLFVTTGNDEVLKRQQHWGEASHHEMLHIRPLTPTEQYTLSGHILHNTTADTTPLRRAVAGYSQGLPLLLEEAALYVIARFGRETQPGEINLPPFPTLVAHRLADLSDDERLVLGKAACVGVTFWVDALRELLPGLSALRLAEVLIQLEALDFIHQRRPSSFSMTSEYHFKHERIFAAVREHLPPTAEDHARMANWRISHSAQRVNEYAGLLAQRYQQAQRRVQAAEYFLRAARQAESVGALREAKVFFREAGNNLDSSSVSKQAALHFSLGRVEWQLGEFEAAAQTLPRALELTERVGDMLLRAQVLTLMGAVEHARLHYADAQAHFEHSLKLSRDVGDRRAISDNLMRLGELALESDELELAQKCFNESLSIYQTLRHEHRIATIFLSMSRLSLRKGHRDEAEALAVSALRIAHRRHSVQLKLRTMLHIATIRRPAEPTLASDIVTHVSNHPFVTPLIRAEIEHLPIKPTLRSIDTAEFQAIVARFL